MTEKITFTLRIAKNEKNKIRDFAENLGVTRSALIRDAILYTVDGKRKEADDRITKLEAEIRVYKDLLTTWKQD